MLFSDRSIWTMVHGIVLGGGALLMSGAALFFMLALRPANGRDAAAENQARPLAWLMASTAVVLWLTVFVGTYINFPPYRSVPPEGVTDLSAYPRAFLLADPGTAWLHAFAMESKEHMPWIASMLTTAVAFAGIRYRSVLLRDVHLYKMARTLLGISFVLIAFVSLMGIFVNKVAPLE
jgi:hypothetical protein